AGTRADGGRVRFALELRADGHTVPLCRMKMRTGVVATGALVIVLGLGCARKEVTERDRLEAVHAVSEARFAQSVREWARAEELLARAVELAPEGDYWVELGATRIRLNNRDGAKEAYQSALKAYEVEAARPNAKADPWVKQAY